MNGNRNEALHRAVNKHRVLIAAHKGTFGGNIIQNTIPAFETALLCGAQIIEVDAAKSTDGIYYAFHTGQEPGLIGTSKRLDAMSSREIETYRLINSNQCVAEERVNRLDDVLEHFRNRCLINIDRGFFYLEDTLKLIKRHRMEEQIIFKCEAKERWLRTLETEGSDIMFMPIIKGPEELALAKRYRINLIGAETLFDTEADALLEKPFIEQCHRENLLLWVNAITLNAESILSAGHDDNSAILHSMDYGWGWLIDRGFDIIQTDWPFLCSQYIKGRSVS